MQIIAAGRNAASTAWLDGQDEIVARHEPLLDSSVASPVPGAGGALPRQRVSPGKARVFLHSPVAGCLPVIEAAAGALPTLSEGLMLGLLLLAFVLWVALGLDRSRRHRLHDHRSDLAGHHRHRAVPHHRRLRRNGVTPAPLTNPVDRPVFLAEVVSGAGPGPGRADPTQRLVRREETGGEQVGPTSRRSCHIRAGRSGDRRGATGTPVLSS